MTDIINKKGQTAIRFRRSGLRGVSGQTAIEYVLITLALLIAFAMMYRALQWYLAREFKQGAGIIVRMYKEDPW